MRFYIASRLENYRRVRKLTEQLSSWGWKNEFDWTPYAEDDRRCRDPYSLSGIALEELGAVRASLN